MFTCPICGSNSYSVVLSEIFKCDGCSALFNNPTQFGNTNKKSKQEKQNIKPDIRPNIGQAHVYPGSYGGVVSEPIKLRRG